MNNQLLNLFFLDSSCPTNLNRCSDRGQCSIRSPNENFNCDCLPGYDGTTCEIGIFSNGSNLFFFQSMEKKKNDYLSVLFE